METLKLNKLQKLIADMFEAASSKEDIDKLSEIKQAADDVAEEHTQLLDKNAEYCKAYKDLAMKQNFKVDASKADEPTSSGALSFADSVLQDLFK